MLLVLRMGIVVLILCSSAYAQNEYFNSGVDFFAGEQTGATKEEECLSCEPKDSLFNSQGGNEREIPQEMKDVVQKIRKNVGKTSTAENSVYLFINPKCRYSLEAIKQLEKFRHSSPRWTYEVYALSSMREYKEFIKEHKGVFENEIPFTLDVQAKVSQTFGIEQVPAFVIQHDGVFYKLAGQPALNDIVQRLGKR